MRYWELKEDKAPTSTPSSLEKIEAVLRDHGVIVFASPTAGVRLATDVAAQRIIRDQNAGRPRGENYLPPAAVSDLPSDFDYSATNNGAIDALSGRRQEHGRGFPPIHRRAGKASARLSPIPAVVLVGMDL